jgi:hypothetical protein
MKKILLLILTCIAYTGVAQKLQDFTRLQSEGEIPDLFVRFLDDKISEDNDKLKTEESISNKNAGDFSAITNYKLQQLVRSGKVLYGDPLTNYANEVLDKLKAASDEDLDHIQLYTLKSNEVNAFATHQGVIFITVGLIGQLENEAQLAFVLAHELTHVIKKHSQLSYQHTQDLIKEARYGNGSFSSYYKYSKDNEEDADKDGFKLAIEAGYDANALNKTFTVLLYSYLPIDEMKVDYTLWENQGFTIKDNLKIEEDKIKEISAEEDVDDEYHTHPNISSRRRNVANVFKAYKNSKDKDTYVSGSEKEFLDLRTLARFEMTNIYIQKADYVKGLYHTMIMRKLYPENEFLINGQSMIWYGLSAFEARSDHTPYSFSYKRQEGEIQHLYYLFNKLDKNQLSTLATQQIWQNRIKYPNNEFLKTLGKEVLVDFVSYDDNGLSSFGSEYITDGIDSSKIEEEVDESKLSKYDKIAKKRKNDDIESDFYFSLLSIINEPDFVLAIDDAKETIEAKNKRKEEAKEESSKPQKSSLNISSLIMTAPNFYTKDNRKSAKNNVKKNDLTEGNLLKLVQENADKLDIKLNYIDNFRDPNFTTQNYNEFSLLYDYLGERSQFEGLDFLPYNAQYIHALTEKYGSKYVGLIGIYTEVEKREFNGTAALLSAMTLYGFPFYLKWQLSAEKNTDYGFYIMNLETHNPTYTSNKSFNEDMNIHIQNAHIYNSLNQITK